MIIYATVRIGQIEDDASAEQVAARAVQAVKEAYMYNDVTLEDLEVIR